MKPPASAPGAPVLEWPDDKTRAWEEKQDLNPRFPPSGGRTPLAQVRTALAHRRTALAEIRTALAKGRTGLALLRTGVSFITIAFLLARVFGLGWLLWIEAALGVAGLAMVVDGVVWYLPARRAGGTRLACERTVPTWGSTVLELAHLDGRPVFTRTAPIPRAETLRGQWENLTPMMRRRFLASDRTDFAEERTYLACVRTVMARSRTGLAFVRTGIALSGLGVALYRQLGAGAWSALDGSLVVLGVAMVAEGFHWYFGGRETSREGHRALLATASLANVWDLFFPSASGQPAQLAQTLPPFLRRPSNPGVWGTTGLALERTVLAERRNVMARLRTVMALSRTGLAFVRTGLGLAAVGLGLLIGFGLSPWPWAVANATLSLVGLWLVTDGLVWHLPAERARREFPYCFIDLEIALPDYGRPMPRWPRTVIAP